MKTTSKSTDENTGHESEVKMIQLKKYSEINVLEIGKTAVFLNQTRN